jgi:uncharacterized protein (TIGR02996 family)
MSGSTDREALFNAVNKDPRDLVARKVFADWLDEFGDDSDHELAEVHRHWTLEKQASLEWLKWFDDELRRECRKYDDLEDGEDSAPYRLKEREGDDGWAFVESLRSFLRTGDMEVLSITTPAIVYEKNDELWAHFETVTGVRPVDKQNGQHPPYYPFTCSC